MCASVGEPISAHHSVTISGLNSTPIFGDPQGKLGEAGTGRPRRGNPVPGHYIGALREVQHQQKQRY